MAIYFTSLIMYLIILSFSISVVLFSSASPTLVLNLIHTNQIYSLEPQNVTRIDEASVTRLDYLQAKSNGDIIAHVIPTNPYAFLVNISIGSPPMTQLLHMDTASHLSWLQCLPCTHCFHQSLPIFDPSRSYTYNESCETESCSYNIAYTDGTRTRGTLARETITFNTIYDESSTASLPNAVFGCGHDNHGGPIIGTGVFGLGYGENSLVHRFGSKFSYCFGSLFDPSYPHNVLVLGDTSADILGDTTYLEIENDIYYVRMEAISVDGTVLPIDPWVLQRNYQTRSGGTFIDTGTALTYLVREAYEPFKKKVDDIFDGRFKVVHVPQTRISQVECYNGDFERDLVESGFPIITFHFSDGAELSLDVKSVFLKHTPNIFCLAVSPSIGVNNVNIIDS